MSSPKVIKMARLLNNKKNKTNLICGENYSKKFVTEETVIYTKQLNQDSHK